MKILIGIAILSVSLGAAWELAGFYERQENIDTIKKVIEKNKKRVKLSKHLRYAV